MHEILFEIKSILEEKKWSFSDLFQLLDENKDNFLTVNEFSKQLDQIKVYSQSVKNSLFVHFDKNRIGMVDLGTFMEVSRKSS